MHQHNWTKHNVLLYIVFFKKAIKFLKFILFFCLLCRLIQNDYPDHKKLDLFNKQSYKEAEDGNSKFALYG